MGRQAGSGEMAALCRGQSTQQEDRLGRQEKRVVGKQRKKVGRRRISFSWEEREEDVNKGDFKSIVTNKVRGLVIISVIVQQTINIMVVLANYLSIYLYISITDYKS